MSPSSLALVNKMLGDRYSREEREFLWVNLRDTKNGWFVFVKNLRWMHDQGVDS